MFRQYDGLAAKIYEKIGYVLIHQPLFGCQKNNKGAGKARAFIIRCLIFL